MKDNKSKIRCVVNGTWYAVRPDVLEKRVEKYGSDKTLRATYVSRDAKRMLREGKTVEQIRAGAVT